MNTHGSFVPSAHGDRIWFLGTTMFVKAGEARTNGAFSLIEQECPPEFATPPHIHEAEDEAFYILQGQLAVTCGDTTWEVPEGGFVYLPRGIAHGFRVVDGPARLLQLTTPGGFERFARDVGQPAGAGNPPPATDAEIGRLLAAAPAFHYQVLGGPPA
ncbi:MAG: quercetin 2,3-dioxygenase [Dehalococcoidia bacterium]|nr:quercetin 2,3-dioxygenase [Dehalococcoidia bacterium]